MDSIFIYCVPLMEVMIGSWVYLLCVPNERLEWVVDLSIVCSKWSIGVARRLIYCVPLMVDRSGSKIYLLCAPNGR